MSKKKTPAVFLVAYVEGGNLTGIMTCSRLATIRRVMELQPVRRSGEGFSADEIAAQIDCVAEKRGRCYRFEDSGGEDDISVINVTGVKLTAGKELW